MNDENNNNENTTDVRLYRAKKELKVKQLKKKIKY